MGATAGRGLKPRRGVGVEAPAMTVEEAGVTEAARGNDSGRTAHFNYIKLADEY
jgi:hypothetical protein